MSPLDLAVHGIGWLHLIGGLLLFLLPGVAAVQRLVPDEPLRWLFAPVASVTLLVVTGIAVDLLGIPLNAWTTSFIAIGWTLALSRRFLSWSWTTDRRAWLPVLFIIPLVALVQALPHVPGDDGEAWSAYPRLLERAWDGVTGDDAPYPVHVDESIRLAQMSDMVEEETVAIGDPYTNGPPEGELFSIQGLREERGFALAMAQLHLLTGVSLPTLARFLPAIWAGLTGAMLYAALRPAPGAAIAGGLTAIMPNTARFLGMGFLVPSTFGVAWIVTGLVLVRHAKRQLAAPWILITGAFAIHIVIGVLTLLAISVQHLLAEGDRRDRITAAASMFLPMVWLLPPLWADARVAVSQRLDLAFDAHVLIAVGIPLYVAAASAYWARKTQATQTHRALAILTLLTGISMIASLATDHRNDATYTRLLFPFLLGWIAWAGLAIGHGMQWLRPRIGSAGAITTATIATLIVALPGVATNLDEPIYRTHDEASWQAFADFVAAEPEPGSIYLADPWQAPMGTMGTQAIPWSVLYPGNPPVHEDDYTHYVTSGGADATWLADRDITYVIDPVRPNAPHDEVAPNVWRIR